MSYLFTSERLGFRNWEERDHAPFIDINADEEVMRYFVRTKTPQESLDQIDAFVSHFDEYEYTFYAVDLLENQEFVGFIGLHYCEMDVDFCPCVEIGWRLKKSVWGNGYATEGATQCLDHAFNILDLNQIVSFTSQINRSSERVMQKIGMSYHSTFDHPKVDIGHALRPHVLYSVNSNK